MTRGKERQPAMTGRRKEAKTDPAAQGKRGISLSRLVERIHRQHPDLTLQQLERAVHLIREAMAATLACNGRIEIRGFGMFHLSHRKSRKVRNPRSGEEFYVAARQVPRFKAGKQLRERVDKHGSNLA